LERGKDKMKQILKVQDLQSLEGKVPKELLSYLEKEFNDLYEYYSLGEEIDSFILNPNQSMVLVQRDEELTAILNEPLEIEFVEMVIHEGFMFYRIGYRNAEEIQLFYCYDGKPGNSVIEKLRKFQSNLDYLCQ